MKAATHAAVWLATLTGPNGQVIYVNPEEVVSMREPLQREHFAPGAHCLLQTVDGRLVAVVETCPAAYAKFHPTDP